MPDDAANLNRSDPQRADSPYTPRFFRPQSWPSPSRPIAIRGGDRPQQSPYRYDDEIILAVNAALAANRPLLVGGPPGTGKSALAADIALQLNDRRHKNPVRFEQTVVTGRTEGRDLLWRFDTVRRLRDAHLAAVGDKDAAAKVERKRAYLDEGILWRAFDASRSEQRMVVLIDEIDKADPDVPSSLLDVLGSGRFHCDETAEDVTLGDDPLYAPFIVITTNDERELSRPFRRRCVTLMLRAPDAGRLLEIAEAQGLVANARDRTTAEKLANKIDKLRGDGPGRLSPNAAEFLDALRACLELGIEPGDSRDWEMLARATLFKPLSPEFDEP